jgi:hypothetical protein
MSQHILHTETINAMIPLVQRIADDLEGAYDAVAQTLMRYERDEIADPSIADSLDHIQGYVNELEHLGGTLRSHEPVRVDFISEVDGEIGYVCWETGDNEAMHFHGAMERCEGLVLSA